MNQSSDVRDKAVPQTDEGVSKPSPLVAKPPGEQIPAALPDTDLKRSISWKRVLLALVIAVAAAGGGIYWWISQTPALPAGIFSGNGRIEADPIDIATKFAGRILGLRVDEGARVVAGQVLAVMDTRDLQASLKKSESQAASAKRAIAEAQANAEQAHSEVILAQQQMDRAKALFKDGWVTKEVFDQRQQTLQGAQSGEIAAQERVIEAQHALDAANHDAELYRVNIADNTLVAPRDGRIAYRIANVGEVLPAGGKVFTMLDFSYVYMDIYLPTIAAGRVKIGNEARIVLDVYPDHPIPAKVTFIADQAQFTPKMVETQTERDKLMFRIRVRIDPERLKAHADAIRSGLPGMAYVRTDPAVDWPARLQVKQ
ncbi:MAG: HlyD family efflux transporter periplasmic adaptor subunit [Proteobacteria bacterium]|nr:HlyD family efflux transporter periplasmic adaptor subunit [Pseudomonadota bacterium]